MDLVLLLGFLEAPAGQDEGQDGQAAAQESPEEAQDPWDKKFKNFSLDCCNVIFI